MTNQKDQINETVGCAIRTVRANKGIKKADLAEAMKMTVDELDAIESGETAASFAQVVLAAGYLKLPFDFFLDREKCQAMSRDGQDVLRRVEAAGRMKSITFDPKELAEALGYERLPDEAARILQLPRDAFTDEEAFEKAVPAIFRLDDGEWDKAKRVVPGRLRKLMAAMRCTEEKLTLDLNIPRRDVSNILKGNHYPSRQRTIAFAEYLDVTPEALYDENDDTVDGLAAESAEKIDGGLAHRTMALAGNDLDPFGLAPTKERIGRHIWILRRVRKTARKDLAGKLGISPKTIGAWENGLQLTSYPMLCKIAEYLDAPVDVLFDGKALVGFVREMMDRPLDEGGLPEVDLSDRLELLLAARDTDLNSLAARFGIKPQELRSWIDLSSRLSLDDVAGAVGLSKEALLGDTIPDIA